MNDVPEKQDFVGGYTMSVRADAAERHGLTGLQSQSEIIQHQLSDSGENVGLDRNVSQGELFAFDKCGGLANQKWRQISMIKIFRATPPRCSPEFVDQMSTGPDEAYVERVRAPGGGRRRA